MTSSGLWQLAWVLATAVLLGGCADAPRAVAVGEAAITPNPALHAEGNFVSEWTPDGSALLLSSDRAGEFPCAGRHSTAAPSAAC